MNLAPYFKYSEFDSPDELGSGSAMQDSTIDMLWNARNWVERIWNRRGKRRIVFKINSGVRTPQRNSLVGGDDKSSHLLGYAVDIAFSNLTEAFVITIALAIAGFTRFGINTKSKFIHVDNDPTKLPSVWFYSTGILRLLSWGRKLEEDV